MTQIRMDKVRLTSLVDTYLNYTTIPVSVVISGTVANGSITDFGASIPYVRSKTRADLYCKNLTTGIKRPINGGTRQAPYTFASTEKFDVFATYTANVITVLLEVTNNTGVPVTLVNQTIEVSAVLHEVPF